MVFVVLHGLSRNGVKNYRSRHGWCSCLLRLILRGSRATVGGHHERIKKEIKVVVEQIIEAGGQVLVKEIQVLIEILLGRRGDIVRHLGFGIVLILKKDMRRYLTLQRVSKVWRDEIVRVLKTDELEINLVFFHGFLLRLPKENLMRSTRKLYRYALSLFQIIEETNPEAPFTATHFRRMQRGLCHDNSFKKHPN